MDLTTFADIFKKGFIEDFAGISLGASLVALASACVLGLFIYFIYKKTFTGVMYSQPFNTSLVLLTLLTTLVILAVTSNVVLSLGMVGALSIVRFRTAIKDPLDLVFLFWSLSVGIILGAGMFALAFVGSLLIGAVLLLFGLKNPGAVPYLLMLNVDGEAAEAMAYTILKKQFGKPRLKSKTISHAQTELLYEMKLKNTETNFVQEISAIPGISNVALVSYNGQLSS